MAKLIYFMPTSLDYIADEPGPYDWFTDCRRSPITALIPSNHDRPAGLAYW